MSSDPRQTQTADDATRYEATVVVRGEAAHDQDPKSPTEAAPESNDRIKDVDAKSEKDKTLSPAKVKLQSALPRLGDDAEVGVEKDQLVTRDGKADLAFRGTLRASAAPASAPQGQWQEYRIYETAGGKHVFSKVTRNVSAEQDDAHEAEVFDPAPESVPSKLLRSARDLTHSRPMTWEDAAVAFFGYDPVAKALYRKISGRFEEQIL
jgi:hypothetical protein